MADSSTKNMLEKFGIEPEASASSVTPETPVEETEVEMPEPTPQNKQALLNTLQQCLSPEALKKLGS